MPQQIHLATVLALGKTKPLKNNNEKTKHQQHRPVFHAGLPVSVSPRLRLLLEAGARAPGGEAELGLLAPAPARLRGGADLGAWDEPSTGVWQGRTAVWACPGFDSHVECWACCFQGSHVENGVLCFFVLPFFHVGGEVLPFLPNLVWGVVLFKSNPILALPIEFPDLKASS